MIYFVDAGNKNKTRNLSILIPVFGVLTVISLGYWHNIVTTIIVIIGLVILVFAFFEKRLTFVKPIHKRKGESLTLDELNNSYLKLNKIGICGTGAVGKSTLKESMTLTTPKNTQTYDLSALVCEHRNINGKFFALLDGPGQVIGRQLNIARNCDYLILMVDHNKKDYENKIVRSRLSDNKSFIKQIRLEVESLINKPDKICFILNKKDLWSTLLSNEIETLKDNLETIIQPWRNFYPNEKILYFELNSKDSPQVTIFMDEIEL